MPHSNITLPAIIFKPIKYRALSSFLLLIKNNLTHIYPIKLKGIGGKSDIHIDEIRIPLKQGSINFFALVKIIILYF